MGNNYININSATIDADAFSNFNAEAMRVLGEKEALDQEYKDLIEQVQNTTKLKKGVISKYFKSRFKAKTKEVVEQGEVFEALNNALDA